ncbi:hypothetical protein BDP27DRAFT_368808 [Rhodocollybia butyracea]|uniref:Uncharacterized protein n=1 Tax=Rhodocollybia butyracea TaxID=206335 RepID=A0A9P5UBA9_9AGAR|nr:hypothetical protein BDP27DRAFT_368808 [Rhodocollybia butyracea]
MASVRNGGKRKKPVFPSSLYTRRSRKLFKLRSFIIRVISSTCFSFLSSSHHPHTSVVVSEVRTTLKSERARLTVTATMTLTTLTMTTLQLLYFKIFFTSNLPGSVYLWAAKLRHSSSLCGQLKATFESTLPHMPGAAQLHQLIKFRSARIMYMEPDGTFPKAVHCDLSPQLSLSVPVPLCRIS